MKNLIRWMLSVLLFSMVISCGPVVITSRVGDPPPPWFYPNRLEVVRYVYFPEISMYYDLSNRTYIYLDGGVWIRRNILPQRYQHMDLSRYRYERIRNYNNDNIRRYHEEHNVDRGRSNRNVKRYNG